MHRIESIKLISEEKLYVAIGKKIRTLRKNIKPTPVTQDKLAKKIGLKRTSIANIEKGLQTISLHQIYQISDALNVTVEDLLPSKSDIQSNDEKTIRVGGVIMSSNSSEPLEPKTEAAISNLFTNILKK